MCRAQHTQKETQRQEKFKSKVTKALAATIAEREAAALLVTITLSEFGVDASKLSGDLAAKLPFSGSLTLGDVRLEVAKALGNDSSRMKLVTADGSILGEEFDAQELHPDTNLTTLKVSKQKGTRGYSSSGQMVSYCTKCNTDLLRGNRSCGSCGVESLIEAGIPASKVQVQLGNTWKEVAVEGERAASNPQWTMFLDAGEHADKISTVAFRLRKEQQGVAPPAEGSLTHEMLESEEEDLGGKTKAQLKSICKSIGIETVGDASTLRRRIARARTRPVKENESESESESGGEGEREQEPEQEYEWVSKPDKGVFATQPRNSWASFEVTVKVNWDGVMDARTFNSTTSLSHMLVFHQADTRATFTIPTVTMPAPRPYVEPEVCDECDGCGHSLGRCTCFSFF